MMSITDHSMVQKPAALPREFAPYQCSCSIYLARLFGHYFPFTTPGCKPFGFDIKLSRP